MAETNLTVPLDELEDENQMILNDLQFYQKMSQFLQNYRKLLIQFSANCICNQNKPLIDSIESLETQYNQLFTQVSDSEEHTPEKPLTSGRNDSPNDNSLAKPLTTQIVKVSGTEDQSTSNRTFSDNHLNSDKSDDIQTSLKLISANDWSHEVNNSALVLDETNKIIVRKSVSDIDKRHKSLERHLKKEMDTSPQIPDLVEQINLNFNDILYKYEDITLPPNTTVPIGSLPNFSKSLSQTKGKYLKQMTHLMKSSKQSELQLIDKMKLKLKQVFIGKGPQNDNDLKLNKSEFKKRIEMAKLEWSQRVSGQKERIFRMRDGVRLLREGKIHSFLLINHNLCRVYLRNEVSEDAEELDVCHECTKCGYETNTVKSIVRHIDSKHNRIPVKNVKQLIEKGECVLTPFDKYEMCSVIQQKYINQENGRIVLGPKIGFKCDYSDCYFMCLQIKTLSLHLEAHEKGRTYECDICHNWYMTQTIVGQHKRDVHNTDNRPILKCQSEGCDYQTYNSTRLNNHIKNIHQTYTPRKCTEIGCNATLKNESSLMVHINSVHYKMRRYRCKWPGCARTFHNSEPFRVHMAGHTGTDLSMECDLCGKRFKYKGGVLKHKILKHNIKNKPFLTCPDCPYKTTVTKRMENHSIVHKTRRPFVCEETDCDKSFKTRQSLCHHLRAHSDVRPFPCDWPGCGLAFKLKQVKERHMRRVHSYDKTRFGCNYCDTTYKYRGDLNRHIRREHSEES